MLTLLRGRPRILLQCGDAQLRKLTQGVPAVYISTPRPEQARSIEDPLSYLPCSTISEYRKSTVIYNQGQPSNRVYLVLQGEVKVSSSTNEGRHVLVDLYQR